MVSVYHLDLEYIQLINNYSESDIQDIANRTITAQLERLASAPDEKRKNTLVLGTILWEVVDLQKNNSLKFLEVVEHKVKTLGAKFHLVVSRDYKSQLNNSVCNITFIDFFALRTYQCCINDSQEISSTWNSSNAKFLFLMGKYHKLNRIGLLYKLYENDLLDDTRCQWSSYHDIELDETLKFIPCSSLEQKISISKFLKHIFRNPDEAKVCIQNSISSHYGGFPFDVNLYKTTNLSLISETAFDSTITITEKTYRAIINQHPFVIAGAPGILKEIQHRGFYTFDEYMTVKNYDSIASKYRRLDAIVENVKNFNPLGNDIEAINKMVEHNAAHFDNLVKEDSSSLQNMLLNYNVQDAWENVIPWRDLGDRVFLSWQHYYQIIKGPSWPSCHSVDDCNNLPLHIQEELRTVFNLRF